MRPSAGKLSETSDRMKRSLVVILAITTLAAAFLWIREGHRTSALLARERSLMERADPSMIPSEMEGATRFRSRERGVSFVPDDRAIIAAAKGLERSKWPNAVDPVAARFIEDMLTLDGESRMALLLRIKDHAGVGEKAKKELLSSLLRASADGNPKLVLRLLREHPELLSSGRDAAGIAMRSWAYTDPYGALDWIRNMEGRKDLITADLKDALVVGAGSVDPARGLKMLAELGDYGNQAIQSLVKVADTPEKRTMLLAEMRKTAGEMEPSIERTRLENAISIGLVRGAIKESYAEGSRWISEAGFSQDVLTTYPVFSFLDLRREDVGDWIGWIGTRFQPEAGKATVSNLMASWTKADYQEASRWLRGADPGPTRDAAVAAFLTSVTESNPDEARKWAMDLPDAAERERAMDLIGKVASRGAWK